MAWLNTFFCQVTIKRKLTENTLTVLAVQRFPAKVLRLNDSHGGDMENVELYSFYVHLSEFYGLLSGYYCSFFASLVVIFISMITAQIRSTFIIKTLETNFLVSVELTEVDRGLG